MSTNGPRLTWKLIATGLITAIPLLVGGAVTASQLRADVATNTEVRKKNCEILIDLRERMIRVETKLDAVLDDCKASD